MSAPSLWTSSEAAQQAEAALRRGTGTDLRDAIELLLQSEIQDEQVNVKKTDAGALLHRGLVALAKGPHEALGLEIGAKTSEIRKAYKKLALKYHPDKNPKTTPLFQAIQTAADKLSDPIQRRAEEEEAKKRKKNPFSAYAGMPRESGTTSATYQAYMNQKATSKPPPQKAAAQPQPQPPPQHHYQPQHEQKYSSAYTQERRREEPKTNFPQPSSGYNRDRDEAKQSSSSYSYQVLIAF